MTQLLHILFISACALIFSEGSEKMLKVEWKPFTCWRCMSLWLGVIAAIVFQEYLYVATPYLSTQIINRYLWN